SSGGPPPLRGQSGWRPGVAAVREGEATALHNLRRLYHHGPSRQGEPPMILPPPPPPPRDPFAAEALARLPLAESFYLLWACVASDSFLDDLFDRHRGRCYQDQLGFPDLVQVLTDALTRYHGSGRRAITTALQRQQLPTRQRAVYGKLAR